MSKKKPDAFGDRMKHFERLETGDAFMPLLPIYARLDGRGFSKFTRGMRRPFDERMSQAMIRTACAMVEQTHALIGYTQSDEISLVWYQADYESAVFFNGKKQKMVSVLASLATANFTHAVLSDPDPEFREFANRLPHFDARVFQYPAKFEVANAFLWRESDATKNALSMAAQHHYSAKQLHAKNGADQRQMLATKGVDFDADYPHYFRHGTFVRRVVTERVMTETERMRVPEKRRPEPGHVLQRSKVEPIDVPSFRTVLNRENFIFENEIPMTDLPPRWSPFSNKVFSILASKSGE